MHGRRIVVICTTLGLALGIAGCASPNRIVAPDEVTMREYTNRLEYPSAASMRISIAGIRSPGRGLVIDVLVSGDSDRMGECAAILARAITGEFASDYLQVQDEHGRELKLRPQRRESFPPWVHKDWPPPPRWPLADALDGKAVIQALPFSSPTLPAGSYRARFRPEARDRLLSEGSSASECARSAEISTEWSNSELR
jgi:hypothetical protein